MPDRAAIAHAAAAALERATLPTALVGFDGFVDSIVHMVDRRHDMSPRGYTPLRTILAFAERCASAAGKSTNIEQVLIEDRFGGNGPLQAGAFARLGLPTTFLGAIADPANAPGHTSEIHPLFRPFAASCRRAIALCPPSHTLCAEFDDGKLMFNETSNVQHVTWQRLLERVGLDTLRQLVAESRLIGINNWSLLGGIEGIWQGLIRDVLPHTPGQRRIFIDLSDPAKRTDADIKRCLDLLAQLAATPGTRLTLGLNLSEAERLARVVGIELPTTPNELSTSLADNPSADAELAALHSFLPKLASDLRHSLRLDTIAIHPREGAAAADPSGAAWFDGPLTLAPRLSTGAGDHFNAGFALAQTLNLPLEQCLATGVATSGLYVRTGESPRLPDLAGFLRHLPSPESDHPNA